MKIRNFSSPGTSIPMKLRCRPGSRKNTASCQIRPELHLPFGTPQAKLKTLAWQADASTAIGREKACAVMLGKTSTFIHSNPHPARKTLMGTNILKTHHRQKRTLRTGTGNHFCIACCKLKCNATNQEIRRFQAQL